MAKFRQIAGWLEHDYPMRPSPFGGAGGVFTVNAWTFHARCIAVWPPARRRQPHSSVRCGRGACAAGGGHAGALVRARVPEGEKKYRKIMGYRDLWS